jgi:hypothetical protein
MFNLVFRIRKRYFDQIVAGTKTVEYRRDIPFWQVRINNIAHAIGVNNIEYAIVNTATTFSIPLTKNDNVQAIFICGKRIHRRQASQIERIKTPEYFSEQGKKDVNTPTCLAFHLGKAI